MMEAAKKVDHRSKTTTKEGCGIKMKVLGIELEHHEKSRASKVNCINHKVPDTCLNLLKTDDERK